MRVQLLAGVSLAVVSVSAAHASDVASADAALVESNVETITILGLRGNPRDVAGSAQLITTEELRLQDYADVSRVLRRAPGVNVQEEDGYGLRPNIGLRGTGIDRSSSITLMEDGILAAPAAYSAPAAYYFPHMGRIAGVEIVKGAAGVRYGPRTQGGSINLFSTPVPETPGGRVAVTLGEENTRRVHAYGGGLVETAPGVRLGGLLEVFSDSVDGFKTIDANPDLNTGYDIQDYGGKLSLEIDGAGVTHGFELRAQMSEEVSDDTYLGLTTEDFAADPFRRYAGSALDRFTGDNERFTFTYDAAFENGMRFTAVAYRTEFSRDWFKLNDVNTGNGFVGISAILDDTATHADEFAAIMGEAGYVSPEGALRVRHNNRAYVAEGLQAELAGDVAAFGATHRWRIGARLHRDEEDRFQWDERFTMTNGAMVFSSAGAPGSQDNRIGEAEALSLFVQDDISIGRLTVTPGVRYERIDLTRTDFAAGDLARTGQGRTVRESTVEAVVPGIGARFDLDEDWSLFGGVHRGFAPPGPGSASDPEDAVNWELGARWMRGAWFAEAVGFYNDYANLVGSCTASTGGGCVIGDQFDGGEVRVRGLELSGGTDLGEAMGLAVGLPVRAAYTWTDAEFSNSFQSGYGPWGSVQAGDALPYLAEHQLFVSAGVEYGRVGGELALTWVGDRRIVAGQGTIPQDERLDSHAIADASAWYDVTDAVRARVQVRNLTDESYAASRSPAGLRPGAPRAVLFGLSYDF